jgi:hypothetical protein
MDGVSLLAQARAAGLTVGAVGDRLVIRGPRGGAPIAENLLAHKALVLAALRTACLDCGAPLPPANRYRCAACVAMAWQKTYGSPPPALAEISVTHPAITTTKPRSEVWPR